ncbi:MAG: Fur family transcriptional regulator [Ilumatobacteraceae bacterium]|jgi:Fur family ferric uptake transcriptional regulator
MTSATVHDEAKARLAHMGQSYTANRRMIVDALIDAGPLTLPELLDRRSELAQSSAYRSLALLTEAGVVRRIVHDSDHARFELAEELTGHHHHHLVCNGCGAVVDVELPNELEELLDQSLSAVALRAGFVLGHHDLDVHGICGNCQA